MTLIELQQVLSLQIASVEEIEKDMENSEKELAFKKADMISRIAKQMVNNADVILRADKLDRNSKNESSVIGRVVGK